MGQIFLMMMGVIIFLLIIKLLLKRQTPFPHYACKTSKQGFCAKFATFQRKKFSLLMHFRCILVEVQTGLGKSWQIGAVARYMMLQKIKLEAIKLKVDHLRSLLSPFYWRGPRLNLIALMSVIPSWNRLDERIQMSVVLKFFTELPWRKKFSNGVIFTHPRIFRRFLADISETVPLR